MNMEQARVGSWIVAAVILGVVSLVVPDRLFARVPPGPGAAEVDTALIAGARDSATGFLSAEALLSHPLVHRDRATDGTLRIRVRAPQALSEVRRPMDLVIVLDHSGSMADENRIAFARAGVIRAIETLRAEDRVALVVFDDDVDRLRDLGPVGNREEIRRIVEQVQPDGSTFLSGGIEEAASILREAGTPGRRRQILLLSDGIANRGLQGEELAGLGQRLGQEGIIVGAMGVGRDYDVMTFIRLAEGSGGGYAYVTSSERIPEAIRGELERADRRLVEDLRIRIVPAPGVRVGTAYKVPMRSIGAGYEILAPTLAAGEEREILVDLTCAPLGKDGTLRPVTRVFLDFTRPGEGQEHVELTLAAGISRHEAAVENFADLAVLATREDLRAGLRTAEVSGRIRSGDYDAAVRELRQQAADLQASNTRLRSPSIASRIGDLLNMATEVETRRFYNSSPSAVATMGQNQAALSAGIY